MRKRQPAAVEMFPEGDDLPLFSGTPQVVRVTPYVPEARHRQPLLPGMPDIDYEHVRRKDAAARARRAGSRRQGDEPTF